MPLGETAQRLLRTEEEVATGMVRPEPRRAVWRRRGTLSRARRAVGPDAVPLGGDEGPSDHDGGPSGGEDGPMTGDGGPSGDHDGPFARDEVPSGSHRGSVRPRQWAVRQARHAVQR